MKHQDFGMSMTESLIMTTQSIQWDNNSQLFALFVVFIIFRSIIKLILNYKSTVKATVVGHRGFWEPQWLVRLRFVRESRAMLNDGYSKFKDSMFIIRRIGTDVLVVSNKCLDELRSITKDTTRSVEPFIHDFAGDLLGGLPFLESDLQNRVLQQMLTPNLGNLMPSMLEELDFAMKKELPGCKDDLVQVDMPRVLARIVARISARILIGAEECRNEEWLDITTSYAENLFITGMILRLFPSFGRPLVAPWLPTYRAVRRNIATARRVIGSIIDARLAAYPKGDFSGSKPADCLQWIMEAAQGVERDRDNLAQRMLILSLSAIHTTALTMAQTLYDLCEHPEYIEPLRAELGEALRVGDGWQKQTLTHLRRLDSVMKESQRFNPIFLLTFNRIYHQRITLSDGRTLPAGTRVAVPAHAMLHDPEYVPGPASPETFDGFRYSRLREDPANAHRYTFAMTDSSNMAFGYGKYACPGRFYAANEIKMILGHLLLKYDFAFPEGQNRPQNFTIDGDMYPDRSARLLMRERNTSES